ncbi:uncharacterized protein LOC118302872 [Scophthalmus maximus]|uniref:uncharacterized protein LOC118302872 n=1 Tax=Scophthalmus maximus TaxID=52904 RepID=UPI0015E1560B|nr:uncharacterized protein LOC118302872 [Scophthalmus maximus]
MLLPPPRCSSTGLRKRRLPSRSSSGTSPRPHPHDARPAASVRGRGRCFQRGDRGSPLSTLGAGWPGSRNVKPDVLSRLFDPEPLAKESLLPLSCVVGAVTWQIEKEVKQANGEAPPPSGCPENRLFVLFEVIHWAHTSLLSCQSGSSEDDVRHLSEVLVAIHGAGGPGVRRGMYGLHPKQNILRIPHGSLATTPHPLQTVVRHLHGLRHRVPGISRKHHYPRFVNAAVSGQPPDRC